MRQKLVCDWNFKQEICIIQLFIVIKMEIKHNDMQSRFTHWMIAGLCMYILYVASSDTAI